MEDEICSVGRFEIGDIVKLKVGGPNMTIIEVHGGIPYIADCVWTEEDKIARMKIPCVCLTIPQKET